MTKIPARGHLLTEQNNPQSHNLDQLTSLEIVDLFNQEDHRTIEAIAQTRTQLAQTIDITAEALRKGGGGGRGGGGGGGGGTILCWGWYEWAFRGLGCSRMSPHLLYSPGNGTGDYCWRCCCFGT